ncbi:restriction endonuclease subunit S, partial [Acinetobacter baumannii]
EFPIPPLAEQKVIADKLSTLLAQVETIKARFSRILETLKNLRQSVLNAAVSGKLTEEWRLKNPTEQVRLHV